MTELMAVRPRRACWSVEAKGIVFDGVADALRVPNTDIRLFGKPESFVKRRTSGRWRLMQVYRCHWLMQR